MRCCKDLYSEKYNVARHFQLAQTLHELNKNGEPFAEYLGKIHAMWDEMDFYTLY